jgi:hypothetical protein
MGKRMSELPIIELAMATDVVSVDLLINKALVLDVKNIPTKASDCKLKIKFKG